MREIRSLPILVLALLATLTVLPGQDSKQGIAPVRILPAQPPEPLVRPGPEPDLELLFTSDVQGFYQPCG
jgi:hypothetical protein